MNRFLLSREGPVNKLQLTEFLKILLQKLIVIFFFQKLKTILVFLHRMPDKIPELNLIDSDIPICQQTAEELRKI